MRKKLGVLMLVLLTGMILGTTQPALIYAGGFETGSGSVWDPFAYISFFKLTPAKYTKGTILSGQLSIAYALSPSAFSGVTCPDSTFFVGTMFYALRLSDNEKSKHDDQSKSPQIYRSFTPVVCVGDIGTPGSGGQGDLILQFLKTVVLRIFPDAKDAYARIDSVNNPDDYTLVADITIVVRK